MSIRQKQLPIAALERIDNLCTEFERKWRSGEAPTIESVLDQNASPTEHDVLLAELIVLDVDYRRRRGETPAEQEYIDRFPDDSEVINDALNEDDQRASAFVPLSVERLAELFPALQIIELIGTGGMGAVYKARQEGLDRVVAIKIMPEEFVRDVKFALRFTREARTLAKLTHPNIVSVYEFGNVQDTYYFLMEYIEGSTLRDVVKARQLTPEHALAIVPHLCDALQYAHDKGVVHRDIKPENILMSADGLVKIADFGLSRMLGNESHQELLTATHQVMGTPRYMAPEQMEGTHGVDHRADIYSLGVVIYEMLTGELPMGRFAAPSQKVEIDIRLDEVVLRTLEKEPQRRYQRASQIKSDIQSITSTSTSAYAKTLVGHAKTGGAERSTRTTLEQQELAGRLLLTRRQLMDRIENSLRPLFRKQLLQVLIGVAIVVLGAQCWARNTDVPHRVVNGVILHVYGVFVLGSAAAVCTRIKRIDYSKPVDNIRSMLDCVQGFYLRVGPIIGFAWWLMWIPVCVAFGFDAVLHPNCLIPALFVGVVGIIVSGWLWARVIKSENASEANLRRKLSGDSITAAYLGLEEIDKAQIR
ncbi:MAG: serine/threonine-protein kinase [Fuerstiella sp.]|jgi:serine/threonine-protein kinase|nr:serine/threonine-protein kinase [Fuerstiella sp.]